MKTKHLFLTAILLVFSMLVVAAPVDPMRALEVAEQFAPQQAKGKGIKSKTAPEQSYEIVYTHRMPNSDRAAFYVVKLGEKGFVIISADDVANPILGYSYTNSWPTSISAQGDTLLPPQVLSYLNSMALQIETAIEKYPNLDSSDEWNNVGQKAVRKSRTRKSADALPDSVGPLLTTTWGQGQYYNALCPEDAGGEDGHVPTGCVATAMAQIINYWGQKEEIKTRGIHSYDCQYGNLTVNYDSTSYDFANMPDALTAESTPEQIKAVAKLMYECGVAVNMQYNTLESASLNEDARAALINFYHFTPNLSIAERAYFSNVEWDNLLHNDIAQGKPVYYSGAQNNLGHSFVCDGYNATGYYHFNFGWGGLADGWYLTSAVSPIGMDFNSNQSVLVGIVPDNTSNVILGQTTGNSVFNVDEPLEFYHLLGHNAYEGTNYINKCNNYVLFKSADNATQLVLDILEHEDQNAIIYDGEWGTELRSLYAGQENDLSPIVSTNNALQINYLGNLYYSGFHFAISRDEGCRRVSNIVTSVDTTTIHLMWQENGNATQWEIEYGEKGFALGSGTRVVADATQYDIIGLKKLTEYDIYIRPVCSANDYGEWNKVSMLSEAPYWTDVVTQQPDGYIEDAEGNITISSAEGLAWFASVANGLNGMPYDEVQWSEKVIKLTSNIDLSKYRWKPIRYGFAGGVFDGQGYKIIGMYVREDSNAGLFTELIGSTVCNLTLENCFVYSGYRSGGIAATASFTTIYNCSVDGIINSRISAGGLVAFGSDSEIINSSSICDITCRTVDPIEGGAGGIVGRIRGVNKEHKLTVLQNCYSSSKISSPIFKGLIVGHSENANLFNCYGEKQDDICICGASEITTLIDNQIFTVVERNYRLIHSVAFDSVYTNQLLEALNLGVRAINQHGLRSWITDPTTNRPILGDTLTICCQNPSNIVARNIVKNGNLGIEVSWAENGFATNWEISYGIQSERYLEKCDTLWCLSTGTNPDTIYGLDHYIGKTCIIRVRSICDSVNHSGWSRNCLLPVDYPCWSDVVTSAPDGYKIDANNNVYIYTAEGLAWLISVVNGENGQNFDNMSGRTITLMNDIDMSEYRWKPLGKYQGFVATGALGSFEGTFDGAGHTIYGINVKEESDYVGMFSLVNNATIKNLTLANCTIIGNAYVGGLCGFAERTHLENVHVAASIRGYSEVGGVLGAIRLSSFIDQCSFNGNIYAEILCGGISGSVNNDLSTSGISGDLEVIITNSWSEGCINATQGIAGGLFGAILHHCQIYNNYSTCNVISVDAYRTGGLVGHSYGSENGYYPSLQNCYYAPHTAIVDKSLCGMLIGFVEYRTDVYNCYSLRNYSTRLIGETSELLRMQDVVQFAFIDSMAQLQDEISINDTIVTDLRDALNTWVQNTNNGLFYTWKYVTMNSMSFPAFDTPLTVYCQAPEVLVDSLWGNGVRLYCHNFDAEYMEIEYGPWLFERGSGILETHVDSIINIANLERGKQYDIYVRSKCADGYSSWSRITIKPDTQHWKDVVVSQPGIEEWMEDKNGHIYVYTPKALAWALNLRPFGAIPTTLHIMNDMNVSAYKWTPLEGKWNIEGHGHTLYGLYMNESQNELSFIHSVDGYINNLHFKNAYVEGAAYAAILCIHNSGKIINCSVQGKVIANESVGGVASINHRNRSIINTFSNCEIIVRSYGSSFGGFCSLNNGELKNCYSASQIMIDSAYYEQCQDVGIFSGRDDSDESYDNIAYWRFDDNNSQIKGSSSMSTGYYAFAKIDTSWVISNPPYIGSSMYPYLNSSLNAWVDANNSESQYLHWVADTAGVNGGFPIFAEEDTKYIITFCNDDGTILQQDTLEFGEMPEYRGGIPTKDSTEQYNYTFIGWGQEVVPVTKDVTYYAQYEETINQYEINFYDWDGTLLQSTMVNYGEWPTYYNSDPWRESDAQYTYTFNGWSPQLDIVTGHQSYYAQYEATLNQYEINFYDWDGTLLQSTMVNYGEWPAYYNSDPWREADAQYTYTFTGWSPQLDWVSGNQAYYAQYEATLNQYEINFYNWDGTLLQSSMVNYGEWPNYEGPALWREADAQYTYTFSGWSPELDMVTSHQSYYAQYETTLNQYEINFYDWDGTLLQSEWLNYGEWPNYYNSEPTREADAQYTYTFSGWSPQLDIVTSHQSYYAQYASTLNLYEINFYNWDSTLLQSILYYYGDWPTYYGSTPWREADAQYTYTFIGWSPQLDIVTGHQSYYAQYESTLNQYEINFYNWDGTLLQSSMVNYGEWPAYYNSDPWREADAQYTYTFTGWSPELDWVTGHQSYYAQYESTLNQYEINFYNWDGTLLQSNMVNYGEWPAYYNSDPWRESDAQYTYTFTGWSPQLDIVTGHQSYYAQYEVTLNQYEITFLNWDGEVLQSTMVDYGAMPEYFGVTPTKPEDEQYVYTFSGWEPEITIVVAYAEYTAQYDATDKVTTVIENTQSDEVKTYKILRNNKIFIIRGDKVYSILGHVIEDWMPLGL